MIGILYLPAFAYSLMIFCPKITKSDFYKEVFFDGIEEGESYISLSIVLLLALFVIGSFGFGTWYNFQVAFLIGTTITSFFILASVLTYFGVFFTAGKYTAKIIKKD